MLRVAAIQLNTQDAVAHNLERIRIQTEAACRAGAQLVVLPENCAFLGRHERDKLQVAEVLGQGPIQTNLARLAQAQGIWLIAGSLPIQFDQDHIQAVCIVWDPSGRQVAHYAKIHLFDVQVPETGEVYQESQAIAAGVAPVSLSCLGARIGLSICYDVRFPELYRHLGQSGVDLFVVPAAFTQATGEAHWEVLLRARAIENLCYVVAPNQWGVQPNGRLCFGHSLIIDPWGEILAGVPSGEGMCVADIDLAGLQSLRARFPVLQHRRME